MTKFTCVRADEVPESLSKQEMVLPYPTFLTEINECLPRRPKDHCMTINFLRDITSKIGLRYVGDTFNPYSINCSSFTGRPTETIEQIAQIVRDALKDHPAIFNAALDTAIKARSINIKMIYFVGDYTKSHQFILNGVDFIEPKDVEAFLEKKPKKSPQK
jgi:hypothetical protein